MSDSAPTSPLAFADLSLPESVWTRSRRPLWGAALHLYLAGALVLAGAMAAPGPLRWGLWAAAAATLVVTPWVIRRRLRALERRVAAASRGDATRVLRELRELRVVRSFAPHAWVTLQEARLHLLAGDGLAAARAFAETARLSRRAGPQPELLSAQVQAWILAGDRRSALEALRARREAGELSARDHLSAAVLELLGGAPRDALSLLEPAASGCAEHPWYVAGTILALARADRPAEALARVAAAEARVAGDPVAEELLRRAQKGLRSFERAEEKRARRRERAVRSRDTGPKSRSEETGPSEQVQAAPAAAPAAGAVEVTGAAASTSTTATERAEDPRNPAGSRKARKQQRRESRRRARSEEREQRRREEAARRGRRGAPTAAPLAPPPAAVAPQSEALRAPGVVLPPLVRPLERPRSSPSSGEPPRFNLPPLRSAAVGGPPPPPRSASASAVAAPPPPRPVAVASAPSPVAAAPLPPLPTRRAGPTGPRPIVPPPPIAPPLAELDDGWGDLDALAIDDEA